MARIHFKNWQNINFWNFINQPKTSVKIQMKKLPVSVRVVLWRLVVPPKKVSKPFPDCRSTLAALFLWPDVVGWLVVVSGLVTNNAKGYRQASYHKKRDHQSSQSSDKDIRDRGNKRLILKEYKILF